SKRCTAFTFYFFQAEDGIRDRNVTGVQTCALPISIAVSDLTMFALAFAVRTLMSLAAPPTVLFALPISSRSFSALALRNTTSSPRFPAMLPPVSQHTLELLTVVHLLLFKNGESVRIFLLICI